jgi:hypothetical protein
MDDAAEHASPAAIARFQRREWAVQRAGWGVLWVILLAGVLGLFGRGPLSRARATDERGWQVEYDRFGRDLTPGTLVITIPAGAEPRDTAMLWLDRGFVDAVKIRLVTPEPVAVSATSNRLEYRFLTHAEAGALHITFELEPQRVGWIEGRAGAPGTPGIPFHQLVYP